jgi:hypothetical protein
MKHLIHSLIKIELFQLKNICPLVYKTRYLDYTRINQYSIVNDNQFIVNDIDTPIPISNIYFVTGYNDYISMKQHIITKYNIRNWD